MLAPGVYDALSAALVEEAGFEAGYLSGASIAYTLLGRPDIGLVSLTEVADTMARIRERVALPVIVDAGHGVGQRAEHATDGPCAGACRGERHSVGGSELSEALRPPARTSG